MTLEKFKKYLTEIIKLSDIQDKVNNITNDLEFAQFDFTPHEGLCLEILSESMNDTSDWISYWFYELDCGRDYKDGCITDLDGKIIKLKTIEDLYNCIINNI